MSQTTLVIYMGLKNLPHIVSCLLDAGLPDDTPAAAIEQGTLPQQQQVITSIAMLPLLVHQEKLASPTLIVIGNVVGLAQTTSLAQALQKAA